MNELQAALFFALLSIPFTVALGVKVTRGIFRAVLLLAAAAVLIRRTIRRTLRAINDGILRLARAIELASVLIRRTIRRTLRAINDGILRFVRAIELALVHAPRDAYNAIDRLLQWIAPPTLAGFRVEYSTLEYYTRTSLRSLTLEQHLRWHTYPPVGRTS